MALAKNNAPTGALTFKKRGENDRKKVLIFGKDGIGKSTFAETYCKEHGLNPIVLDIEDTNYTDLPNLTEFDFENDIKTYRSIKQTLDNIVADTEHNFDTIIIDGVDSLIELFISNANGLKCYADRTKTFSRFLRDCVKTDKHLIFIGQSPIDLDWYKEDENPNKCIIKLNAMVNEKYRCVENYKVVTLKYRVAKTDKN